ncbi:hypothetical protein L1987_38032 [Smallanthus sonchifolius]|uniref:Uncharacterized protein n=1 Tax=Smallanthus sonchifolius TaxID=185202 RepID=A0ACB9HJT6_9ASTR|nr:hypothetical protein L1987_38032 [Smallanthus sonchifolius]
MPIDLENLQDFVDLLMRSTDLEFLESLEICSKTSADTTRLCFCNFLWLTLINVMYIGLPPCGSSLLNDHPCQVMMRYIYLCYGKTEVEARANNEAKTEFESRLKYVMELVRALASMSGIYPVDLVPRQVACPKVDWSCGEPTEMLSSHNSDGMTYEIGESSGAYIICIPFGPKDRGGSVRMGNESKQVNFVRVKTGLPWPWNTFCQIFLMNN